MKKVLCFGELLLRLSPVLQKKWLHESSMPVYIGGAELNVANALAKWELPVMYSTALPDNYLSKEILSFLDEKGIDTSPVAFSGERIGAYYLPGGADLKHESVIYDRAASAFAGLQPGMIDWDTVFEEVDWFHFSAIVPAISSNLVAVCMEALRFAEKKQITVSVDLNYRKKLWQYGEQPKDVMSQLTNYCDIVMSNIWSSNILLGTGLDENIHDKKSKDAYADHAYITSEEIIRRFPKCRAVANTFRFDEGDGIRYYAALYENHSQYLSREFASKKIADKAGSGDCFMAGLIFGMKNNWNEKAIIDYAAAAAFGKLHEKGDFTNNSFESVKNILNAHE